MAADRTIAAFWSSCVGYCDGFFSIHPFCTNHVKLVTCMYIMAGKARDIVFLSGVQVMEIVGAITESIFFSLCLRYQCLIMTVKAQLLHRQS